MSDLADRLEREKQERNRSHIRSNCHEMYVQAEAALTEAIAEIRRLEELQHVVTSTDEQIAVLQERDQLRRVVEQMQDALEVASDKYGDSDDMKVFEALDAANEVLK